VWVEAGVAVGMELPPFARLPLVVLLLPLPRRLSPPAL